MTTTARLGMTHIESTDTLVGAPGVGVMGKYNDAINRLDDNIGGVVCTSGTRPSVPYAGQIIYETDTRLSYIRNTANTSWTLINTGIPVVTNAADITSPFTNQIIYVSSVSSLMRRTAGGAWVLFDSNTQWLYKPATESVTNSTTLQNDDVWAFPVLANSAYALEGYVVYDGAQAPAGGLKTTFTVPSLSSIYYTNFGSPDATAGTLAGYNMVVQGAGATRDQGTQVSPNIMSCAPKGVLVVGANAGTLQFQWAQTALNPTPTRILGGSWMKLTKIA